MSQMPPITTSLRTPAVVDAWLADAPSVPNEPMKPIATSALIEYAPAPLRRHIGEPFDGLEMMRGRHDLMNQLQGGQHV
ncbi:MAG: hypothetical protein HY909_28230 [Deltaproteobacteria bacterium]|nr:hypothetical protein [Deltaproteobacteria bacterium]